MNRHDAPAERAGVKVLDGVREQLALGRARAVHVLFQEPGNAAREGALPLPLSVQPHDCVELVCVRFAPRRIRGHQRRAGGGVTLKVGHRHALGRERSNGVELHVAFGGM